MSHQLAPPAMATIEDLVAEVADPQLRMRLQAAVRSLKEHKRFGLVFEEHEPERAVIPNATIELGDSIIDRTDPDSQLFIVTKLMSRFADLEPAGGGETERHFRRDLQLLRRFGEPTYPALVPIGMVGHPQPNKRTHSIICGENFHVLQLLLYLYEEQVDCI